MRLAHNALLSRNDGHGGVAGRMRDRPTALAGSIASGTEVFVEPGFLRRLARAARRHADAAQTPTREEIVALARQ